MTEEQFLANIDHIGRIYEQTKDAVFALPVAPTGAASPEMKIALDGLQELRNIACEFAQKLNTQ